MRRGIGCLGLMLLVAGLGCRQLGILPVTLEQASPDGRYVAQVRNHLSIDPPRQSLWLVDKDGEGPTRLRSLSEDQDWCNQIAWSADGATVAFLVQDAWVAVYDAETGEQRAREWLVPQDGYPTVSDARELQLSSDGRLATYRACQRTTAECSELREFPVPARGTAAAAGPD